MNISTIIFDNKEKVFLKKTILDSRSKGFLLLSIIISVLYSNNLYLLVSLAYISVILAIISKMRLRYLIVSSIFLSTFSLIASLIAYYVGAINKPYIFFLIFTTRFLTVFFISSWFLLTVEPYELAIALEKIYFPPKLVWFIIMIYQFVPVVSKEAKEINEIKKLKGLNARYLEIRKQAYILKKTLKPLITGAINRGVDLAESMVLKGFEPKRRKVYAFNIKLKVLDFITILLSLVFLILIFIYLYY